ncbi:IclR family transcriptional regulator [Actinomycetospora straminea]|uniref:IclR family transcriptional regulator n=1 Tax=Actinomycetospora straminea TaxID=663607 RepID=A0ABP9DWV4_9PSEU|nr:IclR family transcriptional regulator C-terminal domain-containing protein [Actinomycetospora straminea]MDD7934159.1 IclR family transcriptional regulator C-terminal domain-containing protein [Actinomycetospora straminea]
MTIDVPLPRSGDVRRPATPTAPRGVVAPGTLRVLRMLAAHPEGVDLAALGGHLGRTSTGVLPVVQGLLRTGHAERTPAGAYRLRPGPRWGAAPGAAGSPAVPLSRELPAVLSEAVGELYRRARAWAYLVEWADDDHLDVVDIRGHQGLGLVPELPARIPPSMAHALAVSKVLVAHAPDRRARLDPQRWTAYTPWTITSPAAYDAELARVRRDGYALDREEYATGFACVCAPIADPGGRVSAAIAVSLPASRLRAEQDRLVADVTDVARTAHRRWYR